MSKRTSTRAKLLGGAAAAVIAMSAAGAAQAQSKPISIEPQSLSTALYELGVQTGQQIIFSPDLASSKASRGAASAETVETALNQILAGTGLSYRRTPDAWLIVQAGEGGSGPQSASAGGNAVQALIVTAQKREEDIQDVPIAISAFSQEDLTRSQVAGGPDLMTQVPNMTFTKTNFSSYSIQIRGIGTQAISATVDPAVAVAFNNTPFIRNRFFEQEFYDLERVEVLRGPQGTLYGRNATAGVVNILSAKPKFYYEAKVAADVANYQSTRLEGMVNVPLVEDVVALRLAGAWTKRDGYVTNQITGNQIDGRDLWSTRLSLRFAPTDSLDVNLIWEHFNEDDDRLRSGKQLCKRNFPESIGGITVPYGDVAPGNNNGGLYEEYFSQGCEAASLYSPDSFEAPNGLRLPYYRALARFSLPIIDSLNGQPFDPYASTTQSQDLRVIESTVDPTYTAETNIVELQASFDLSDVLTLTSETSYLSDTLFSSQDYNRFNTKSGAFSTTSNSGINAVNSGVLSPDGVFCDPQIGCADRLVAVDLSTADSAQFSQELRLSSDYDGPFNFSLGANFLRYDTEDKYYVFINTLTLSAAARSIQWASMPDYQPGVTDNHQCLKHGYEPPDSDVVQSLADCTYIDPNPITSLNDLGHNYFLSRNPYKLISYAAFGEVYYQVADNLKVTGGFRWTVDKKEAPRIPSWVLASNTAGYPVAEVIEQEWREPTGRLTIDWKPTDETLIYASYAHGYKAGGANPPANGLVIYGAEGKVDWQLQAQQQAAVAPRTFEPEFVDAFEVGTKNTFLDGRLTLNGDIFYYDYQGYQISQIINRSAINLNFDAKVWGVELEADWRPIENLRLGLKGGYEKTKMADGSRAVDTMDRTAGHDDWYVTGPFPTLAANCILPTYTVTHTNGDLAILGGASGGILGPCETAYVLGLDPVTNLPYVPNPTTGAGPGGYFYPGYPGFDPTTAPNGGAGFYKDLSGNELPNAPHFTATVTADYTLPLPNDWLATLHTDLYYQSEAWTRVFNTPGYDKLKAYTNVNLAAIFTNEPQGWKVMAYVKNVFDRDSITGAFLNSDDTGLTTNVFLTEPRLYGVRITKDFNGGGPWWTGAGSDHPAGEPYPLTVELSGQVQRHSADYALLDPDLFDPFPAALDLTGPQNRDLDWGDGREARLIYRPAGAPWRIAAGVRYGRTNNDTTRTHTEIEGDKVCALPSSLGPIAYGYCDPTYSLYGAPPGHYYSPTFLRRPHATADSDAKSREEHTVVDFEVGMDAGLGLLDGMTSTVGLGIRYAQLKSNTHVHMLGNPSEYVPEGWNWKYTSLTQYEGSMDAQREFKGVGPTLSWEASAPVLGDQASGRVGIDWTVRAGVLFGKQKTSVTGDATTQYYANRKYSNTVIRDPLQPVNLDEPSRSKSVNVPVVDLSLGLSYEIQRIKVGAGYRWERYFDALDAGYTERKAFDRTIDGPYFKVSVGFGG